MPLRCQQPSRWGRTATRANRRLCPPRLCRLRFSSLRWAGFLIDGGSSFVEREAWWSQRSSGIRAERGVSELADFSPRSAELIPRSFLGVAQVVPCLPRRAAVSCLVAHALVDRPQRTSFDPPEA